MPEIGAGLVLVPAGSGQVAEVVHYAAVVAQENSLAGVLLGLGEGLHGQAVFEQRVHHVPELLGILLKLVFLGHEQQLPVQQLFPLLLGHKLLSVEVILVVLHFFQQGAGRLVEAALFALGGEEGQELEFGRESALGHQMRVEAAADGRLVDSGQLGYFVGDVLVDACDGCLSLLHFEEVGHHFIVLIGEDGRAVFHQRLE